MIGTHTEHGFLRISICNYEQFQSPWKTDGTVMDTDTEHQRNTDGTLTDTAADTNQKKEKKVIKEKKEKNLNTYTPEFEAMWAIYPRKDGSKLEAFKPYQSAIKEGTDHGRII